MRVPAFCDRCGAVFPSSFEVEGLHTTFVNCGAGPCPECGSSGHIPDGVYNFIGSTIELLSGPASTMSELQKLATILSEAREHKTSPEEVSKRIKEEVPGLSGLKDLLPKTRSEFYSFVTIGLTVVGLFLGQLKHDQPPNVTVNQVVNVVCQEQTLSSDRHAIVTNKPAIKKTKVGRNDPCPCGSGKKYKKCCGK